MIPQAIQDLMTDIKAAGGTVTQDGRNRWEFTLPRRWMSGNVTQQIVGSCGYYVRDGVAHYRGVRPDP